MRAPPPVKILLLYPPSPAHLQALRRAALGARLAVASSLEEAGREIEHAEAVLGNRWFLQSLPRARRLRWVQSNSTGVDVLLSCRDFREGPVVLTSARGVYDEEVADHAVAMLLALGRGLHLARDAQRRQEWRREGLPVLRGSRCLVLGAGAVGAAVARRLAPFGVECHGVCRRPREDPGPFQGIWAPPGAGAKPCR